MKCVDIGHHQLEGQKQTGPDNRSIYNQIQNSQGINRKLNTSYDKVL